MANTRRKTSVYPWINAALEVNGEPSNYSTAIELTRQEAPSPSISPNSLEAVVPSLAEMTTIAAALRAQSSGSTVSVRDGNMAGSPRFAVSIYPQRSASFGAVPTWELLFAFGILNADLLLLPDHALGTWFDGNLNRQVVDAVVCPFSLDEALCLGMRHSQKAIYDLEAGREIPIPGNRRKEN